MDGVTILNQIEGVSVFHFRIILMLLCFVLMALSIYSIHSIIKNKDYGVLYAPIIGIIFSVIGFGVAIYEISKPPHINYEVTISDKVSFKDLTDKYEIIGQRGEIYVVRER